jgi:membrane protease YdiL (CAAX protease family)
MTGEPEQQPTEVENKVEVPSLVALPPDSPSPGPPPAPPLETRLPDAERSAIWLEVLAVLAVGVVPLFLGAITSPAYSGPAFPYWADTVFLTGNSICTAFVTLYLIARSGEPWARFGLPPPVLSDVWLGAVMVIVAWVSWVAYLRIANLVPPIDQFPKPRGPDDYVMMVVKFAASAFAEELVTRAYLITRLEQLMRSRGVAVVLAAILFASYHAYLGLSGVVYAFVVGIAFGIVFLIVRRVWPLALGHAVFLIRVDLVT